MMVKQPGAAKGEHYNTEHLSNDGTKARGHKGNMIILNTYNSQGLQRGNIIILNTYLMMVRGRKGGTSLVKFKVRK
jgi:hypothetical protein